MFESTEKMVQFFEEWNVDFERERERDIKTKQ
jgi:hypothetical protein